MYSISYFFIAIVDIALLIWALNICKKFPTPAVILSTVPLSLLWFDNITVSLGSTLGDGQPLLALNFVRFMGHYVLLPATIIAIGSMARLAEFKIAQSKWFIGAFCVLATYFSIHDLYLFSQASFYPSCFADTFRYTTHIADYTACSADADIGAGFKIMPWPAMTLSIMTLILGAFLWWRRGWKWLFIGAAGALPLFAIPYPGTGGIYGNVGEPIICGAIVVTAAWLSGWRPTKS
ncbi:MAG: hypothetical protein HOH24_09880 [Chromatiales bacterium]|jgi:hypothetical protein|nr:hypothetical protein [Chromatiales bacterium]